MNKITDALRLRRILAAFCISMLCVSGLQAATLVQQYDFAGNFDDSLGNGDPLTPFNTNTSNFAADGWSWTANSNPGGGVVLAAELADPQNYSIGFRISYEQVGPSWRKIISFKGSGDDDGLYFYNANLQYYPFHVNTDVTFSVNTFYDFVFSRSSASGGTITVYVIEPDATLTKVYEESDPGGVSIPLSLGGGAYEFRLFMDDTATNTEWSSGGTVKTVRVWDGPLAEEDVGGALEPEPEPEPEPSIAETVPVPTLSDLGFFVLLIGLMVMGALVISRRQQN